MKNRGKTTATFLSEFSVQKLIITTEDDEAIFRSFKLLLFFNLTGNFKKAPIVKKLKSEARNNRNYVKMSIFPLVNFKCPPSPFINSAFNVAQIHSF